jgi:hypothetical protein
MKSVAIEETELREAFLTEAASAMPTVQWGEGPDRTLVYPEESPALGTLLVSFDRGEITLRYGPRGWHNHLTLWDDEVVDEPAGVLARQAVENIQELVTDERFLRWGVWAVTSHAATTLQSPAFRVWRTITPWVKTAVWSRTL